MYNLNTLYSFLLISSFFLLGCSKEEESSSSSSSNNNGSTTTPTSCSTITAKGTVTSNGVSYSINALAGQNNSIGIEVINATGAFTTSYSMKLLEVSNGSACGTSTTYTETLPGIGKFFEFKNMPAFSSSTSTVAKIEIMLDGNTFFIEDLHVNQ